MTGAVGGVGERLAAEYLERAGYVILHRNFRFGRNEIDLIARKGKTIVFVEVKTRRGAGYGEPEEAVTAEKIRRIRRVASAYLAWRGMGETGCRFDVVAVLLGGNAPTIRHTEDIYS